MGISGDADQERMQNDLDRAYEWANINNMQFNGNKFELLSYKPRPNDREAIYLTPDGQSISQARSVSDLGITMQETASFELQIESMCLKGKQQAGWVLRTFETREAKPLLTLYKALVLPHLEYCCQLWSPVGVGSICKLEATVVMHAQ